MVQPPETEPSKSQLFLAQISLLFQDKRVRVIVAVAILAIIALVTTLIVVSNNNDNNEAASDLSFNLSPEDDYVFQPANSAGPDPFTPSYANYTISLETENLESGEVSGNSHGLYGGTNENACDIDQLIAFLQANPAMGAAWAEVQGITPEELEDFIRGLTPAVLLQNTLVINHGYSGGEAIPFLAVLEAGTAVLVDDDGIPRARCACGNPLLPPETPPEEEPTPTEEEGPTPTPPEETLRACPDNPPYGIHKNADDDWTLKTEEGVWVWKTSIPGWENESDPTDVYITEAEVPGYIEECYPCPEEEEDDDDPNDGGNDEKPSYEKDQNGGYKTSTYVLNTFNLVRLSTYVVIAPIITNDMPTIIPVDEADTEEYDDKQYDDDGPYDKNYDGCFPPCPEDGEWGWDLFGPFGYTWVDPDGTRWYWTESGWVLFELTPVDSSDDEDTEEAESSGVTYTDYRDLPGWSEDCEECPPWGWEKIEDGSWRWVAPNGQRWYMPVGPSENPWELEDGDGEITISDISELPGFVEDCHECPEWGWQQNEDGGWEWHGPNGIVFDMEPDESGGVWGVAPDGMNVLISNYSGPYYPELYELPGFDEDCHECPEWGWQQNEDGEWEWHSPGGNIYSMVQGEDGMIWGSPDGDSTGRISDLPGYIEECEDCPEWGWEEKADGVFVWNDPLGRVWFPESDGSWYYPPEDKTIMNYRYLAGWIEDCHCDDQTWGWVDVNGDGIEEWYAPDGTVWGEFGGIWRPVGNIGDDYSGELSPSGDQQISSYRTLPGWGDDCFEGSEVTEQPTPTPTATSTPTETPTPTPTPTPTTPGLTYSAPYTNWADTSCSAFYSRLEPMGDPEAPGYRVELSVTSDLGTEVRAREIATGDIDGYYWQEVFYASEFWIEVTQWPTLVRENPTFTLTGYALPDGPGGATGPSEMITGSINLTGCNGG